MQGYLSGESLYPARHWLIITRIGDCTPGNQGTLMNVSRLMTVTVLLSVLYGCAHQQPVAEEPARLHAVPFNVVATGDARTDAAAAATFSWATAAEPPAGDSRMEGVQVNALIEEAIANTLQQKGFNYLAATGQGDLLVRYAVSLNDAAADSRLAEKYGMQADIGYTSPDPEKFEKGTLVIDILERQSGLSAWRSSLQGFAYLDISEAERRQRLQTMVNRMLSGLPSRN